MELGSLFLILALLVLVVLFITRPFLAKEESPSNVMTERVDHERSNLLAEYDRVLTVLQELDLDFALGKIPEEAYPPQRSVHVMRGVDVLRKLETIHPLPEGKNSTIASATLNNESMLERSIAQNEHTPILIPDRANPMGEAVSAVNLTEAFPDDDLELLLANRRRVRQEKSTGFCAMCGDPVRKSDRYCPKCGARIG